MVQQTTYNRKFPASSECVEHKSNIKIEALYSKITLSDLSYAAIRWLCRQLAVGIPGGRQSTYRPLPRHRET